MDFLNAFLMLFLIMDPLGNLPIFMSVLKSVPEERRFAVLVRELLIALLIMMIFLFAGQSILNALSLKQEAVSISGGIILFIIAIRMIFPGRGGVMGAQPEGEPFIVPLATPMIAGPSILAMLILLVNQSPERQTEWALALFAAWAVTAIILMSSKPLFKILKDKGLAAIERLMGMILVMMSVQMFLDGVLHYVKFNS
jgi:multiple antibiotic resistance protein